MNSMENSKSEVFPDLEFTPPNIKEKAEYILNQLLPQQSKHKYELRYSEFKEWCKNNHVIKISENVLLVYFTEKMKHLKYSSLWSLYSMLKSTLSIYDNIDISNFCKLKTLIKRQGNGYHPKKASIFLREEINKFMAEAPDDKYLMFKVVLVMGIAGACRCQELANIKLDEISENGDILIVKIPNTKNNLERSFIITNQLASTNVLALINKYISLRPKHTPHNRLFLNSKNGKCNVQPVGINTISKIPTIIATYLKLKNPEKYTGHSFRRTSATLLVNEGGDLLRLKQHGGWKSSTVAEGYVESSIPTKTNTSKLILQGKGPSQIITNNVASTSTGSNLFTFNKNNGNNKPNIINYGNSCTINININN